MDHLPKVIETCTSQPEVPYLSYERFKYDSLGLIGFPARKKFDVKAGGAAEQWSRSSFLQHWLFFGSMIELFNIYDVHLDTGDFVRLTEVGREVVTTERLQGYIATWIWKEAELNKYCLRLPDELFGHGKDFERMRPGVVNRYSKILVILQTVVTTLSELDKCDAQITRAVWDSIILLGTTLRNAARIIFRCYKLVLEEIRFERIPFKTVSAQFEKGRWCPAQCKVITEILSLEPCSLFFCSQLDRSADVELHSHCTTQRCLALLVNEKEYQTQHAPECSNPACLFIGPDIKLVSDSLRKKSLLSRKKGNTTVYQYTTNGLIPTQVKLGSSQRFVAISHVWADGLGNPHANELPQCQISLLQNRVNGLFDANYWPVPFWIDTLSVPLNDAARKIAIGRMQWVYSTATNILVLDRGLQRVRTICMSPEEISTHIMCSNWCRRLWTLQEGSTQDKVHWQFADKLESFPDLKAKIWERGSIENSLKILGGRCNIVYEPYKVTLEKEYAPEATNVLWTHLWDFFQGIKAAKGLLSSHTAALFCMRSIMIRDCSRPSDESLCFSAITNNKSFPPSALVNMPAVERFKALFCSDSMHPIGILFLDQKRYEDFGYRWIPKSLLQHNSPTRSLISHVPDPYLGGTQMGWYGGLFNNKIAGLQVRLPGFEVSQTILPEGRFDLNLTRGTSFNLKYSALIHAPGSLDPLATSLEARLAILTPILIWSSPTNCTALVVTILHNPKDKYAATNTRFEALVELSATDRLEIETAVTADFNEDYTYPRSEKMGAEYLAREWRVG